MPRREGQAESTRAKPSQEEEAKHIGENEGAAQKRCDSMHKRSPLSLGTEVEKDTIVNIRASLSCDINVIGLGFQLMAVPTNPAACRLGLLIAPRSLFRALQPGAKRSNHSTGRSLSHKTKERGVPHEACLHAAPATPRLSPPELYHRRPSAPVTTPPPDKGKERGTLRQPDCILHPRRTVIIRVRERLSHSLDIVEIAGNRERKSLRGCYPDRGQPSRGAFLASIRQIARDPTVTASAADCAEF
ncbi:hypothetical protein HPB47_003651 [Ixodes persulcatus]|uniref:Uncharacterized protein n=1 Tax=Ixodes persulcatus TaxID=34615 RepID=A0AC60PJG2_IXOPE|nr:hypothetical protein HPB47_003651 [Ixodes persulcatus]